VADPIIFYFDFTSPYSYLASEKIDALAASHGRTVDWRPILLGGVFQALGTVSLVKQPGMADYSVKDFARSARFLGLPYAHPASFPVLTVASSRAYYWLLDQPGEASCALARRFAHAVFRAYFADGCDIAATAVVLDLAQKLGADGTALDAGIRAPAVKERLRAETDAAVAQGVFGAPWIVVDGEAFWGADRLPQIERWLADGAF